MSAIKANRGFITGIPLYIIAGLGIALVLTGLGLKYYKVRYESEYQERLRAEAVIAQMVETARKVAEENERIYESWKSALAHVKAVAARDNSAIRAELDRVRNNPVRPDGTAIQVASCPGPKPDGVSEKFVSLAEYESLQERSAYDALQVTQLQDYIRATRSAVEGERTP